MVDVDPSRSSRDPVTGAYPRESLSRRADPELARAARTGGSCALFLFDVDYFKGINEAYGHRRGDELLRQLAARVAALSRNGDELFRFGADEFVLLLPDITGADAVRLATAVADGVRGQDFPGTPPVRISVSLGVATFPDDADDLSGLLACADRRNHLAKDRGRACAVGDDAAAAATSSPLLEREPALATVNDFLTRLDRDGVGALAVAGARGSGHSRFLHEVGRISRLRGFHVADAGAPGHDAVPRGDRVIVVADRGAGPAAVDLVARWRPTARTIGLVYADPKDADDAGAPVPPGWATATAGLTPWSVGALRIWLRSTLRGEPTFALVMQLHESSGGLPGQVHRELESMRLRGRLTQRPGGTWSVVSEARRRRSPWPALPVPMTALLGRTAECDQVVRLLGECRLVTLAGPGGIGKTRLSLAVAGVLANTLADGAAFVALGELERAGLVIEAVATCVGAEAVAGGSPFDAVVERLAGRDMLLVLDNLEQVLDAKSLVADLLDRLPGLRVLTTSRERLSLPGERVYQVPPLPLPAAADLPDGPDAVEKALADYPALALFHRRAMAVDADFQLAAEHLAAVTEVCRRLDGLPLAIELAAARIDRWSPQELLGRLGRHLDALREGPRDVPARQRTLRGAIDWSVNLLAPADRVLFGRLAVFTGGCTADAAAAVVDPRGLDVAVLVPRLVALVEKNLLTMAIDDDGGTRWTMLETLRMYALELLAGAGEQPDGGARVWARHSSYFGRLAGEMAELLMSPDRARGAHIVEREYANLRTAFETAMGAGDVAGAMRFCRGLWQYWCDSRHLAEGRDWCARLLACPDASDGADGADLLYIAAVLAHHQDDHDMAQALAERCLARMQESGDRLGAGRAHSALGMAAFTRGEYELAVEHHARSLADWQELGFTRGVAVGLGNLTKTALRLGDAARAGEYIRERLALSTDDNPRDRLLGLEDRIDLALLCGDVGAARELLAVSVPLTRELKDAAGEVLATHQLGLAASLEGARADALRLLTDALARRCAMNLHEDVAISLECVAREVAPSSGDAGPRRPDAPDGARAATLAAELLGAAGEVRRRHHLPTPPSTRPVHDAAAAAARLTLGGEVFERSVEAGRDTPLDQLLDRAREPLG